MQPVRPDKPAGAHHRLPAVPPQPDRNGPLVLREPDDGAPNHRHAGTGSPRCERPLQHRAPNTPPRAGPEPRVGRRPTGRPQVPDAGQRPSRRVDAEPTKPAQPEGEKPFPAGLVDGLAARLVDPRIGNQNVEPRRRGEHGDRQADGPGTGDEHVGVHSRHPAVAATAPAGLRGARRPSATSSQRMRTASSGVFSSVNSVAVSHAVWTSGSARPSTTTAR